MVQRLSRALRWVAPTAVAAMLTATVLVARARAPRRAAIVLVKSLATLPRATAAMSIPEPTPGPPARCPPEPPLPPRALEIPAPVDLVRLMREDPAGLGSASIGSPIHGGLWGGVELQASEGIDRAGAHGWGTESVVRSIERAVREVRRCVPDSPKLFVGDIARKGGGFLLPHRSHQSGLDADLGYYYLTGAVWFQAATPSNLDAPRTWALVRALLDGANVESIFMDRTVQRLLREHAETIEEDRARLPQLFEGPGNKAAVIRHLHGHLTHFHVRFTDAPSAALGARLAAVFPRFAAQAGPAPARRSKK